MTLRCLRQVPLVEACRAIAQAVLAPADVTEPALGRIRLRAHQLDAVRRARASIAEFGGVLVADAVGLGKTYTALGITRHAQSLGVIAPASLCAMWRRALATCDRDAWVMSHESLSRWRRADARAVATALIVDEAHHARNPLTRRYATLARLAAGAEVVLLSATPIHNRRRDLDALLALFLGSAAELLDDAALARCIVRREHVEHASDIRRPVVEPLRWISLPCDAAPSPSNVLDSLLAIPPPWPQDDDRRDAEALVRLGLVRRWASSDAALRASLRRRLVDAEAMLAALADGRRPTRDELRLWTGHDDAVQLAFTALVVQTPAPADTSLIEAVRDHAAGVRRALRALDAGADRDAARAAALTTLRREHTGTPIIAFSCYARTVLTLWRAMPNRSAVAALTADGAVVAGGRLTRDEALHRFAPLAAGVRPPSASEAITMLLATDLLAEGLDLRDAGVVVHLDLPWTSARLEQRVGRTLRPGSPHATVASYAMRPPASADKLLRLLTTLRRKSSLASETLGGDGWIALLGGLAGTGHASRQAPSRASPELNEAVRSLLSSWLDVGTASDETRLIGVAPARRDGFIALIDDGRQGVTLLASGERGGCTDSPRVILARLRAIETAMDAMRRADNAAAITELSHQQAEAVLRRIRAWSSASAAVGAADVTRSPHATPRAHLLARVARTVAGASRGERAPLAEAAGRARAVIANARGAGAERTFTELVAAESTGAAWLELVARVVPSPTRPVISASNHRVRHLLLLVRSPA